MGILGNATTAIFAACKASPSLYRDLLSNYNPKIGADRVELKCPSCNEKSAWLVPGSRTIRCNNINKCGGEISVLAASIGINAERIDGESFRQAVLQAATITGVQLEQIDFTPSAEEIRVPESDLEAIWQAFNSALLIPGSPGIKYLLGRNFDGSFIAENFGAISQLAELSLEQYSEALIKLGFLDSFRHSRIDPESGIPLWDDRLIIPCRDAFGKLVGFVGRCLRIETRKQKYLFTTGYKKVRNPFGLHRARKAHKMIIVEGHLDALKLNQLGILNVVAVGGCHLSGELLLLLKQHGASELITFFDADTAGERGIEQLLNTFDETLGSPELFIGEIPYGKDPDAYCDLMGLNPFLELASRAAHAHKFRARHWFKSLARDELGILHDGELPRYIERCAEYLELASPRIRLRQDTFIREVCALSGIDRSDIKAVRKELTDNRSKKTKQQRLRLRLGEALGAVRDGNLEQGRSIASEILLETASSKLILPTGEQSWNEVENYFTSISKSELIGVRTGFKFIDDSLSGARRLIMIAGETNVGKTTLLGELAFRMAHNHDTCVLFLSFEMERVEIASRLLALQSQIDWRDLRRCFGGEFESEREGFQENLKPILDNIVIVDENDDFQWSPENVIATANEVCERTGRARCAIIIDDFESVPAHFDARTEMQRDGLLVRDFRKLRRLRPATDPTFVISTMRKAGNSIEAGQKKSPDDVKGNNEKIFRSDVVMVWNRFSEKMLYEKCGLGGARPVCILADPQECDWKKLRDDPEIKRQLREADEYMTNGGFGFSRIDIVKVRDGMSKGAFDITVNYRRNQIIEGLIV